MKRIDLIRHVESNGSLAPGGDTQRVSRGSAFEDDVAKRNLAAILNQHGLTSVRSLGAVYSGFSWLRGAPEGLRDATIWPPRAAQGFA